jgi:hypothetical protein
MGGYGCKRREGKPLMWFWEQILRIRKTFLVPIPIVLLAKNWNPIRLELGTRVGFHLQNKYTKSSRYKTISS